MNDKPPTAEESMQIAETFVGIAEQIVDGQRDATAAALENYFTNDPATASLHLWYFASIGPILVAAAMKKLHGDQKTPDDFWIIEKTSGEGDNPAALVAAQSVAAYLNDDESAAHDALSAHFDVAAKRAGSSAAHEALFEVVVNHLQMLAHLIKEGAFA